MNRTWRVAVIGAGYWGPNLLRNFLQSDDWEVLRLVDLDPAKLAKQAKTYPALRTATDLGEALRDPDVDALAVATPVATHYDVAKAALEAGKHVLVEKPLASTISQGEELCALAERRRKVIFCDHTFLYSAPLRALAAAVQDRETFGEIVYIDSMRANRDIRKPTANVIEELGPHDFSIADYLVGEAAEAVATTIVARTNKVTPDVAFITLRYPSGVVAHVHLSWVSPVKVRRVTVAGNNRMALWDDLDLTEKVRIYMHGIPAGSDAERRERQLETFRTGDILAPALAPTEALAEVVRAFAAAIGGAESISAGSHGLAVMRSMDAAMASIAAGGTYVPTASLRAGAVA